MASSAGGGECKRGEVVALDGRRVGGQLIVAGRLPEESCRRERIEAARMQRLWMRRESFGARARMVELC